MTTAEATTSGGSNATLPIHGSPAGTPALPTAAVTLRRTRKGWVEPAPARCSKGHPLSARQVLVGTQHCACMRTHRTHTCRVCGATTYTPPFGSACRRHEFDEG